jgi:predicted PhzF superfamily epimerase YddE/YHI9
MQSVAAEMNLSETAFLISKPGAWSLRWFTPKVEVDLCGHATLASAHALWEVGLLPPGEAARFDSRSGRLGARQIEGWIELDFPATREQACDAPEVLAALGVSSARYVGRNKFDYIVELESENAVRSVDPDHVALRKLPVRGVMITSRSTDRTYDFVSRFFAPGAGVDEDPVTGSAHCCLTPYWAERLNKRELVAFQASSRGGVLRVRLDGDRVKLAGRAVTVLRGELTV